MSDGCPESIRREIWEVRTCGRPIRRDGMCDVHAAAKDRREIAAALSAAIGFTVSASPFEDRFSLRTAEVRAWWEQRQS